MTNSYSLIYENPYNRRIARKITNYEMMKNQVGQPELFDNNQPQSEKDLSAGAIRLTRQQKSKLNKMLRRGGGVEDLRRPGDFIKPVRNTRPVVVFGVTDNTYSPYYNSLELRKVNESCSGGAIAGIGEYKGGAIFEEEIEGGFSFSSLASKIGKFAKKLPKIIKKGIPKIAKSAVKFMKGSEGQRVIGNVLTEVGTQAVKKIFEGPRESPLEEAEVLGSGILVCLEREDIKDDLMRDAYDRLVVNGQLRRDKLPLMRKMGYRQGEMSGGFIGLILGIIGAVAAAASTAHSIASAEADRAKVDEANKIRANQVQLEQTASKYIDLKKEKGIDVDVKTDPFLRGLKSAKEQSEIQLKKLGGKSNRKKGLEPKQIKSNRGELIKMVMKERGVKLPEASKIIKEEGLKY